MGGSENPPRAAVDDDGASDRRTGEGHPLAGAVPVAASGVLYVPRGAPRPPCVRGCALCERTDRS